MRGRSPETVAVPPLRRSWAIVFAIVAVATAIIIAARSIQLGFEGRVGGGVAAGAIAILCARAGWKVLRRAARRSERPR